MRLLELIERVREEYISLASWWLHEMRETAADLEQRLAPGRPHRTILSLSDTAGTVVQQWRNGAVKSAEFQRTQAGDLPADRSEFWPTATADTATVHVVLPESAALMRRIWLPASADKNLTAVVELQLERELPIPRDQVQADWRIEGRNRGGTRIEVGIAMIWRSEIERLLNALSHWKLRVISIGVDLGGDRPAFNFAPRATRRSTGRLASIDRLLMVGAAMFMFAYLCVIGAQWLRERIVVEKVLTKTSAPALRVERMRSDLDKRREPVTNLQKLMVSPSSAEILADLTAVIPPDSWLQQLEIHTVDDGSCTIEFTAITPAATLLVDRLARSPHFENVELQSSSASGPAAGRDRAELSVRCVRPIDAVTASRGSRENR